MSNLVDLNLVKTVGTTLYVPPTVYSKWSAAAQVNYVAGNVKLGYEVKIQEFIPVSINSLDELQKFYYKDKLNFVSNLAAQLNLDASNESVLKIHAALLSSIAVREELKRAALSASSYTCAEAPADFDVNTAFVITNKRICRTSNTDSSELYLSATAFKEVFAKAHESWSTAEQAASSTRMTLDRNSRRVDVYPTHVEIGCQTVRRYEMEAVALELGFIGQASF